MSGLFLRYFTADGYWYFANVRLIKLDVFLVNKIPKAASFFFNSNLLSFNHKLTIDREWVRMGSE